MELVIVTWSMRITLLATLAVGAASLLSGAPIIDAVDRAVAVAFVFTMAARILLDRLEPPEKKILRLRARREARRKGKGSKEATTGVRPGAVGARSRTA